MGSKDGGLDVVSEVGDWVGVKSTPAQAPGPCVGGTEWGFLKWTRARVSNPSSSHARGWMWV